MSEVPRYAIVPTNGRACLAQCVAALEPQVDEVILVTTHNKQRELSEFSDMIISHNGEVNISRWWNIGLDLIHADQRGRDTTKYDVAIINDDVIVPEGWFDAVSGAMRGLQAAAGCSGGWAHMPELHTHVGPVPGNPNPMQGFAFMVAGEKGLRANEDFRWYWSDNFVDWESRKLGGTVVVPGFHVQHLYPNQQVTGEMQVMIAEDAQKFSDYYGMRPW